VALPSPGKMRCIGASGSGGRCRSDCPFSNGQQKSDGPAHGTYTTNSAHQISRGSMTALPNQAVPVTQISLMGNTQKEVDKGGANKQDRI
jgi:hypothetical protein